MERKKHHLVVVGAGSGGFAAARTARDLGADVALVDHGPLGGLCILRGCMPSKTLIASSDAAQDMRDAAELGIHAGNIEIDFPHIMRRKRELIKGFADYRIDGIQAFPLYEGPARFVSPNELLVDEKLLIEGKKFIIATGSVVAPAAAVHGLQETGYIDSDGALELERLPKSLIVLGGEDHDIGDALTQYYRDEGIEVHTETQIMRTSKRNGNKVVHVVRNEVEGDLEAEELLYCLGRVPNFEGLDLDVANVPCHHITGS